MDEGREGGREGGRKGLTNGWIEVGTDGWMDAASVLVWVSGWVRI